MRRALTFLVVMGLALVGCGGDEASAPTIDQAAVTRGIEIYGQACQACHGPNGEGVEGLGKPWVNSEFIDSRSDEEMLQFLIEGRPSDHPDNDTGISMMPRGGNPNITDQDLLDLIAYMRTLNL